MPSFQPLVHRLNQSLHEGLHDAPYEYVGEEEGMAKFVFSQDNDAVHDVLQPVLEAWSGVELVKTQAYGLRVYLNESRLFMHIDQVDTHIISAILHVDHDRHSEPWPLVIEVSGSLTAESQTSKYQKGSRDSILACRTWTGTRTRSTWSQVRC